MNRSFTKNHRRSFEESEVWGETYLWVNLCMTLRETVNGTHCSCFTLCCGRETTSRTNSWAPPDSGCFLLTFHCFVSPGWGGLLEATRGVKTGVLQLKKNPLHTQSADRSQCLFLRKFERVSSQSQLRSHSHASSQEVKQREREKKGSEYTLYICFRGKECAGQDSDVTLIRHKSRCLFYFLL